MLSKLMCGAVLASAAAGASAQTWNFTYTGFQLVGPYIDEFLPNSTISGSFSGMDRNGDGGLSAAELTSFTLHSSNIVGTDFARCAQDSSFVNSCSLDAFSFGPQGDLGFTVNWRRRGDDFDRSGGITSGVNEFVSVNNPGEMPFTYTWLWTPATLLAISPPPVPEPSHVAMALTGLLALGLARLPLTRRPRARQT